MVYSGLAIQVERVESQAELVATRQAQRIASKEGRAQKADNFKLKGNELFRKGDYLKAADLYYRAVEVHGPKPIFMSNLAAAYYKLEIYDEAEWAATVALEYDPHFLKARFRRGLARKEIYDFERAAEDFQAILHYDPHNQEAKEQLEMVQLPFQVDDDHSDEDAGYPGYSESPWASYSDSDTPDCRHKGVKKVPCRFYNHDGCKQGTACEFSHAPDDKSVRDELGRNVCTHYLLNNCTYGTGKCVYSHDRTHLPDSGWWNYPEQVASAIRLQPILNKGLLGDDCTAILRAHPKVKKFAARPKRKDVVEELFFRHRAVREATERAAQNLTPMPTEKFVLLISLEEDFFTSIHEHFLSALKSRIKVATAITVQQALQDLGSPNLIAVYLTDAGAARPKNRALVTQLADYSTNGGTVVAGGQFSNHVRPKEFEDFTQAWGLTWTFGSYHRTIFSLNPTNVIVKQNPSLCASYSMKSLHASQILPEHAIYKSTQNSHLQSLVFPPVRIEDKGEAPATHAKVGKGWFGFIGDVNGEVGSTNTVLAMLGLLDRASQTLQGRGTAQDSGKKQSNEVRSSDQQLLVGSLSKDKKCIIIVTLTKFNLFQQVHADHLSALQQCSEIKFARTAADLIVQLSTPNLCGVYIADEGIVQSPNAHALKKLVEYATDHAGTVVIGGLFPSTARPSEFPALFDAFGLPWKRGAYIRDRVVLDSGHPVAARYRQSLPHELSMNAVHIGSFNLWDGLYFRADGAASGESPVVQMRMGDRKQLGSVGYIGDVNAEEGTAKILLYMFGLLPTGGNLGVAE